ncbi:MAG: hypothetical protein E5W19_31940 [Mesorhizobium sp.]|nr:MAG: hypothetical protein E5W19_31940 [Mesorhizobium sp.]
MPLFPQNPHAGLFQPGRAEADQRRHALAGEVGRLDVGDDEVSFGHGKKRQLRDADQLAHVRRGLWRDRQGEFAPAPAMPPEIGHGQAVLPAIDPDRIDVGGAHLRQHQPPHTRTCAREGERGRTRRRRDQAPFNG